MRSSLILTAIVLVPAAVFAQAYPENPEPRQETNTPRSAHYPLPEGEWLRIQRMVHGQPVIVNSTYAAPLHCRFAGATDAFLFCDLPDSPEGTGYRFERENVLAVEADLSRHAKHRNHPGYVASILASGMIVGFCAAAHTDAGGAARAGAIGAAAAAIIGAPFVLFPPDNYADRGLRPMPGGGVGVPIPLFGVHMGPIRR